MIHVISCKICGKELRGRQTCYCSILCKNKADQSYPTQKKRGIARKIELINKLGGKCTICGYKKNLAALTFHHKVPKLKKFKLDMRSLSNRKLSLVKDEVKKCILICHNCHAELHNPKHNLALYR